MHPIPLSVLKLVPDGEGLYSGVDVATLGVDVRQEHLKTFLKRLEYCLAGPSPVPVFIPKGDPFYRPGGPHWGLYADNYRGLLLVPHKWLKRPLTP